MLKKKHLKLKKEIDKRSMTRLSRAYCAYLVNKVYKFFKIHFFYKIFISSLKSFCILSLMGKQHIKMRMYQHVLDFYKINSFISFIHGNT